MKLDIKLVSEVGVLYCPDSAVATVAVYWGKEYEMIFSQMWSFFYNDKDAIKVGERISLGPITVENLGDYFYGIHIDDVKFEKPSEALEFIRKRLNDGSPISSYVHKCFLPVHKDAFQDVDILYILYIGFDKNGLYYYDISNGITEIQYISNESFSCSFRRIDTIIRVFSDRDEDKLLDKKSFFLRTLIDLKEINMFEAMKKFADDIETCFDISVECENVKKINSVPLVLNIGNIYRSRELYSRFILYISEVLESQFLCNIYERFRETVSMWSTARLLASKCCLVGTSKSKERFANKIREIADFEKAIYDDMVNELLKTL